MKLMRWAGNLKNGLARGVFPHEMSFFLELPWRNLLLSPQKLSARLALKNTSRVLEVGAGSGFYSVTVARALSAGHLELLDLQPEMLEKARRKLEAAGVFNVGYTPADAGILPFATDSFDVIFLVAVFGEIAEQESFLREARRVLKPGGILSISEHLPDPDFSPFAKVKSVVEKEGFEFFARDGAKWSYTASFRKASATP
jgi:ubiquinone/menaquinone biosynthesis C-methylase UbiE